jgi:hypothetical protein
LSYFEYRKHSSLLIKEERLRFAPTSPTSRHALRAFEQQNDQSVVVLADRKRILMLLKVNEVFVPGSYPQHTYVEREGEGFEQTLRDALDTPGQIVSLSGPSKSGKTVLVEKVVGRDFLITISGGSLRAPDDVWNYALDWMDVPNTNSRSYGISGKLAAEIGGKGSVGLPLVAKGELSASTKGELGLDTSSETVRERRGLAQVVDEIANSEFVILLDDFHYMDRIVQQEVAKVLKEAVRLGIKIVTASVSHRGDDVVRANPELRGRVRAIDLKYWDRIELRKIAIAGFVALNIDFDPNAIDKLINESAGSPQLMQLLCLQACFVLDLRERQQTVLPPKEVTVQSDLLRKILEQTSASTDFRSLVDVLDSGPRTRGTERKTYRFYDQTDGDVYRVVLRALADDPPRLSYPYEELLERTVKICHGESPVGSSVTGTCLHMTKLAQEKFPNERAIDWDETKQVLDIPDPYLLFYLRWSGRLKEN